MDTQYYVSYMHLAVKLRTHFSSEMVVDNQTHVASPSDLAVITMYLWSADSAQYCGSCILCPTNGLILHAQGMILWCVKNIVQHSEIDIDTRNIAVTNIPHDYLWGRNCDDIVLSYK